jgi:HSP20 family protein
VDDVLDEFSSPRALRREIQRLFDEDPSPRSLWQAMDRLFDAFVTPMQLRRRIDNLFEPFGAFGSSGGGRGLFVPDVELVERDKEYLLRVDLPGIRQDDVQVSVDDYNTLTIRGERRDEQNRRDRGGFEYTERSYGTFTRSIELPRGIDVSKIDADYRDGVLELHIPKTEQAMARRQIPIRGQMGRELGQSQQSRETSREQPRVMSPANATQDQRSQVNSR